MIGIAVLFIKVDWLDIVDFFTDIDMRYLLLYLFLGIMLVVIATIPIRLSYALYVDIRSFYTMWRGKYDIVEDVLVNKTPKIRSSRAWVRRPYIFYFPKYSEYQFDSGDFTNENRLNDIRMYDNADLGDTFYLIGHGSRIILAYNTKDFELDEELNDFMKGKRS